MDAAETWASWNGERMPLREVRVPALDRGFLFGDAVYEVLRVYSGRPWLARRHADRLRRSLAELRIPADADAVARRMDELLAASGVREGHIYAQITRGAAPRQHAFPSPPAVPNELIYVQAYAADPYLGQRHAGVAAITHPDLRWRRCDIKSTNLLGNVLAKQAAAEAGAYEALLVDPAGLVTEAAHSSVFAVRDGELWTAAAGPEILPGVTRSFLLDVARKAGLTVRHDGLPAAALPAVDELFVSGTSSEVLPVVAVDGRPVGPGTPGPITRVLAAMFQDAVRQWLATGVEP